MTCPMSQSKLVGEPEFRHGPLASLPRNLFLYSREIIFPIFEKYLPSKYYFMKFIVDSEHIYLDVSEVRNLEYFYFICGEKMGLLGSGVYLPGSEQQCLVQ